MATPTYELIETTTLTSSASSVTFTSITQDYRDLVLVNDAAASSLLEVGIRLNSDTGSNYSVVWMQSDDGFVNSGSATYDRIRFFNAGRVTTNLGESLQKLEFLDYSATDKHKTLLSAVQNDFYPALIRTAHRWANTSAISNIEVYLSSGTFNTGSTFSLYGIAS